MKKAFFILLAFASISAGLSPVKSVKMKKGPTYATLNPVQNVLYVTNFASDEVLVVDPTSFAVKGTFYAGYEPLGIAVLPTGDKLFVTNRGPGLVKVLDARNFELLDDVKVGGTPASIVVSPKGALAFVNNWGKGKIGHIDFIDTSTHRIVAEIEVGIRPLAAAISHIGDFLYVVCGGSNEVYAIDIANRVVAHQIPVGITPDGVAVSPDGNTLYVANGGSNDISVIDLLDMSEKQRLPVGNRPFSLAVTQDGKLLVVESGDQAVSIFSPSLQKLGSVKVGRQPVDVCLSKDGRFAFVTVERDNKLAVLAIP
jgi:YVTN family beta-propeller protein